jgi:hypothetical protein
MRLLWLYLAATLLVACWSWSFPDELLHPDGGGDARTDLAVDASPDGPARDSDAPKDLPAPDGADGPSADTGKPCSPPCDKAGTLPICDDGVCRGCRKHSECAATISDGELCAAGGSCPSAKDIYYVSDKCGGTTDGSKTKPFCKIADAVDGGRSYVLVRAGTYTDDLTVDKSIEIYGEPGTQLKMGGCDKLIIKGTIQVVLAGLEILGEVDVKEKAEATLLGNTLGPSVCVGVSSTADTKVTLERNLIRGNTGGGLDLDGTIRVVNNIIVNNGQLGTSAFGGAKLKPIASPACAFFNNTIYGNESKATKTEEVGGVRCEVVGIKLINNIFWENTYNGAATKAAARQYDPACEVTYNLEQLDPSATVQPPNITAADPGLVKTGSDDEAGYYRLTGSSPAIDQGDPLLTPPTYDFGLQLRSDGKTDIGADELDP